MSTTQQPQFTLALSLTDIAAEQVRKFMTTEGVNEQSAGLRVSVLPGGCSGFQYGLNIEETAEDGDLVLEDKGIRIFVDEFSAQYLNGVTIGYHTSMTASGFTFENPNASGGCGCGSSFAV